MLTKISLENFGPLKQFKWNNLGAINLIIGGNGSGKTFLFKALYCSMRTLEEYGRGDEKSTEAEILAEKLYWTFQTDQIGDLVTKAKKGEEKPLLCKLEVNHKEFSFQFGKDTTKKISHTVNRAAHRESNSVFLPAKEVLSLLPIILKSREQDKSFGFDDAYLDLARALRVMPRQGKSCKEVADSRKRLEELLGGRIEFDEKSSSWLFKHGKQKFPLGVTSEGTKKIAILDTLLGNRYLGPGSIVFIDEPEAALHPTAISELLDIIALLAKRDIQFFLASHSYFVVKKLSLIAQETGMSIPIISDTEDGQWMSENLKDGMPDNPIINESINLYKQEVELSWK